MITFFRNSSDRIYAVQGSSSLSQDAILRLEWLLGDAELLAQSSVPGTYVGPRATMITPWSTNAVEITQNMGLSGLLRIEAYDKIPEESQEYDPMLLQKHSGLTQDLFKIDIQPESILHIEDIGAYNLKEGLALNSEEVDYLNQLSTKLGRKLTDSEVFGFSQVNSEHCRHKIFNGTYVIDGQEKEDSLFSLIKKTSKEHPENIVSAYKDNVAFIKGPVAEQFSPEQGDVPSNYTSRSFNSVISVKAETHNFPTTVEPFNGAATGSGGEIRDRLAGGKGSIPLAGTAVYMTAYSRNKEGRIWESRIQERPWLYQTPLDILIKASNGASDFGNKFGQPLIAGSVLTYEHEEDNIITGYDKVIMMAGGIGYGVLEQSKKDTPEKGDVIVILGGDNYRIGMGGAAVSSADTGAFGAGIELNAVQRSNPEMQKRAANAIRALVESSNNPIVSIHDHGAGGHLNCLSELVEETGGTIEIQSLPIGDPTLSDKEIIGNESQERMGLIIKKEDVDLLRKIAERERAPMYVVGEITEDHRFVFNNKETGRQAIDLGIDDLFGNSPKTLIQDHTVSKNLTPASYETHLFTTYLEQVLQLEAVACKDWLTNKVDRCVGGKVAVQQCCGPLQLPLNNCGVIALDYNGKEGVATSIGHAPASGLIDSAAGARNALAESLTNIVWSPFPDSIKSLSLSANWMWPCKNPGEDARLYKAVEAISDLAISLGINIPTGKDSLSMAQKYKDKTVLAPGTVIVSACGHCEDITKVVEPVAKVGGGSLYYLNFSSAPMALGGSSFLQTLNQLGDTAPDISDSNALVKLFNSVQSAIKNGYVTAGHDISAGGIITCILEMCFSSRDVSFNVNLGLLPAQDLITAAFSENAGVVLQGGPQLEEHLNADRIPYLKIGEIITGDAAIVNYGDSSTSLSVSAYRDAWYESSYLMDREQSAGNKAEERYNNYKHQPLAYSFPSTFTGKIDSPKTNKPKIKAAILREKGSNSEREMANALYRAGFEVRDVHMTDLISGRENLEDIQFLGAVGGFSNSDVLGSAKGWAGAIKYNSRAKEVIDNFFSREDTLSVGICNGCQLFIELDLIHPHLEKKSRMLHNESNKHESGFTSVTIQESPSIMLNGLVGSTLGVWISHGEGKFYLPEGEDKYSIVAKYGYDSYPANPNGSDYNTAMMCSNDGRHLVMMPHIERSFFPWNWAHYPDNRNDSVSPWGMAFVAAREWLEEKIVTS